MSGGSYDYKFRELQDTYVGRMHDIELDSLMKDLIPLLKSLEWWQSGDIGQDDYREEVKNFKTKWLSRKSDERIRELINNALRDAREKLETALLFSPEKEDYL